MKLHWPLAVIDFEASSLDLGSYPIEVGIAVAAAPDAAIETWSSLIQPDPSWPLHDAWDRRSAGVHGIAMTELRNGLTPRDAMQALNARLDGIDTLWCDGGRYDRGWLAMLAGAAGEQCKAQLADIEWLFLLGRSAANRFATELTRSPAPHRAAADACRILEALRGAERSD